MSDPVMSFNERQRFKLRFKKIPRRSLAMALTGVAVLIIVVGGGFKVIQNRKANNFGKTAVSKNVINDIAKRQAQTSTYTAKDSLNIDQQYTYENLKAKNYPDAVEGYYGGATIAYNAGDKAKAKSLMEQCIRDVPEQYIPSYVYYSLAGIDKDFGDKKAEKTNLQLAFDKGNAANDMSQVTKDAIKKRLQELGG